MLALQFWGISIMVFAQTELSPTSWVIKMKDGSTSSILKTNIRITDNYLSDCYDFKKEYDFHNIQCICDANGNVVYDNCQRVSGQQFFSNVVKVELKRNVVKCVELDKYEFPVNSLYRVLHCSPYLGRFAFNSHEINNGWWYKTRNDVQRNVKDTGLTTYGLNLVFEGTCNKYYYDSTFNPYINHPVIYWELYINITDEKLTITGIDVKISEGLDDQKTPLNYYLDKIHKNAFFSKNGPIKAKPNKYPKPYDIVCKFLSETINTIIICLNFYNQPWLELPFSIKDLENNQDYNANQKEMGTSEKCCIFAYRNVV